MPEARAGSGSPCTPRRRSRNATPGPRRAALDKVRNLLTETQPLGNLTPADPNDYVTRYGYDEINQLITSTNAEIEKISYTYDRVGNMTMVVDPFKNATADTTDFITKVAYDRNHRNHRQITTTDAEGKVSRVGYDKDGNTVRAVR